MSLKTVFDDLVKRYELTIHEQVEVVEMGMWTGSETRTVLTIVSRSNSLTVHWHQGQKFHEAWFESTCNGVRVHHFSRDLGKRFRELVTYPVPGCVTRNGVCYRYRMRHYPGKLELLPELLRGKEIIDDVLASELVRDAWHDQRYEGILADYVRDRYDANET